MGATITTKFDPSLFFQNVENVALQVPAGELFGLGRRTLDLLPAWGAVVSRADGSDVTVSPGGTVDGSDARSVVFFRLLPFDVYLAEERFFSRDGFECRVRTRFRLILVPEQEELAAFRAVILAGHRVAKLESIVGFLAPVATKALTSWLAGRDAEHVFSVESGSSASTALADAMKAPLFTAGLSLCGEPSVEMDSPGFAHVRRVKEDATRRSADVEAQTLVHRAVADAQTVRLDHLAGVVQRLEQLSKTSPSAPLVDLVRTFPEAERNQIFEALFAADRSRTTRWIVVAAGEELLFFDASNLQAPARRCSIAGPAGAIRSIQYAEIADGAPALLLGAATGVYCVLLDKDQPDAVWLVPHAPRVRGGFNAVCETPDGIFASHSELGLWRWAPETGSQGEQWMGNVTRGAHAIRDVQFVDHRLFCTVDDRAIAALAERNDDAAATFYTGSRATLTCLRVTEDSLYAGNSAGEVLRWSHDKLDRPERLHQGAPRPVESLWFAAVRGVRRLVFSDTSPFVYALIPGEGCSTRYEAGGQTLRRVESAADFVVGITELRDRFLVWKTGRPSVPFATVNIAGLGGHTIQDFCLVPEVA